ncbi:DUF4339 domain-containing protein [bacterium]|nr:DUF4339 domain-containing protein [bacterium]
MQTYILKVDDETRGPYVREQLQKMWNNGIITANSEISKNEYGPWVNAIDFFVQKIEPANKSELATATRSELVSVPPKKNMAADLLKRVARYDTPPKIKDDFGLSPQNPIPASSIPAAYSYLGFLADKDLRRVKYKRLGQIESKGTKRPVDEYKIISASGEFLFHIYINAYAGHDAEKAPQGLKYFRPLRDSIDTDEGRELRKKLKKSPEYKKMAGTAQAITEMQYGAQHAKVSGLSGLKVFWLRYFSVTGYIVLIGATLGGAANGPEGLIGGWVGAIVTGGFWGFISGIVSYLRFKKHPDLYRLKKHVYVSSALGAIAVSFVLIVTLLYS